MVSKGEEFDLYVLDARGDDNTGIPKSHVEGGAKLIKVPSPNEDITQILSYSPTGIEHYMFHHPQGRDWSVAWLLFWQHRVGH